MSASPDVVGLADQASLQTSRSRLSIVASLRRKTSRLLIRNITVNEDDSAADSTADSTPPPVQPRLLKNKRSWFHSVGARFRHGHAAPGSSESSQDIQVELEKTSRTTNPPSSSEISPYRSPVRHHPFRGRLRLHSLPARFRRRGAALFSRSSSLSDSEKENFMTMTAPPARPGNVSNTGSWSSFRSGIQRAVREIVDGNFRFSEDRNSRNAPPPRTGPRPPLRTLWTIMSADSSEGHSQPTQTSPTAQQQQRDQQPPPQAPKKYQICSPNWSPDWSPPSSPTHIAAVSPSDHNSEAATCPSSPGALTHSGSTAESSPVVTPPSPASLASPSSSPGRGSVEEVGTGGASVVGRGDGGGWASEGHYGVEEESRRRGVARPRVVSHPAGVV